ncbi:MAG: leucyl aminopeptidase [Acidimicrobiales bacterium]
MPADLHLLANLPADADVVGHAVCSDRLDAAPLDRALLDKLNFEAKADQVQVVPDGDRLVVLVGLGPWAKVDAAVVRKAGAALTRATKKHPRLTVSVLADLAALAATPPAPTESTSNRPEDATTEAGESTSNRPDDASTEAGESTSNRSGSGARSNSGESTSNRPYGSAEGSPGEEQAGATDPASPAAPEPQWSNWAQALVEGLLLAGYEYRPLKSEATKTKLADVDLVAPNDDARAGAERGRVLSEAVTATRDLVNEPGGSLTARRFAKIARRLGEKHGFDVKVFKRDKIAEMGMGGLLGVNRGSTQPPRFVQLRYRPAGDARGTLALVGKGITFDSGGLSLKTAGGMMTMKCDMAGAAAVLGAFVAISRLCPEVEVRGYLPLTDNMTGGDASRPGDVFTLRNGKTIEVLNTDAEGRLVLADALSLASEAKPDAIIDLATLTGACVTALGSKMAGLMGRNDAWLTQVETAARCSGEQVWRLPLPAEYKSQYESSVADMKNIGNGQAGALVAGLILGEFVADGLAWAHLDIAGPAFTESEDAEVTKGGSGYGVRLLVELAERFEVPTLT